MIGIPSISALVLAVVSVSAGSLLTFGFFTLEKVDNPSLLIGILFIAYSSVLLYLLVTRLRVLTITDNSIKLFYPLLLKNKEVKITEIVTLNWRLRGTAKYGDFKELQIENRDKSVMQLTDFEFGNLDKLENYLLPKLSFKPNLTKRREVEIRQANGNYLITIFGVLVCIILIIVSAIQINRAGDINLGGAVVITVCALMTIQFTLSLLKYKERLRDYKNARVK